MTALNIKGFQGKTPRIAPRLLQGNFATEALNCRIGSGRLDPIKGPALVHTSLAAAIQTLYRYRNAGVDYWDVWPVVVDAVRSPTSQDQYNRTYYTGDGEPRVATFASNISGAGPYPAGWFVLGVYIPTTAMGGSVSGGSAASETRSYTYTFVTQHGEEGAPCTNPALISGAQDGTWNLTGMELPPPNSGTISGATSLGGGVIRITVDTSRGVQPYEQINCASVVGMTDLNTLLTVTNVPDATHIDVTLTSAQTYTSGGTWSRQAPHNTTNMRRRIYRTVGTSASYLFVDDVPATLTTYSDTKAKTALGAVCPSISSYTPPKNLSNLRLLANGSLGGIAGNQICFSEPGKPYSWPIANRYAFAGVGIATIAVGNSLVVLTDSFPLLVTASDPSQASIAKMTVYAPCVAKRSVVDAGDGAIYASHDGLYFAGPQGATLLTADIYRLEQWQQLAPSSFVSCFHSNRYYAVHTTPQGNRVLVWDRLSPESVYEINDSFDTLLANQFDGLLYGVKGNKVYQLDADDTNRYLMFWQSPEFQFGPPVNFTAAQIWAEYSQIVPPDTTVQAANTALLANADNILGAWGTESGVYPFGATNLMDVTQVTQNRVQFNMLKNGVVVFTQDLADARPFRVPGGERAEVYQLQIAASIPVHSMTVAQSMHELGQASQ